MFCRHCGANMPDEYKFCASCGTSVLEATDTANPKVAEATPLTEPVYTIQATTPTNSSPYSSWAKQQNALIEKPVGKRKKTAGLLGIFLGFLGVHRFYLGYTEIAFIQILLGVLGFATFGITAIGAWVWAIVDVIRIFKGKIDKDADDNLLI